MIHPVFRKYRGNIGGGEERNLEGRRGGKGWKTVLVGRREEIDESGKMEHEIVKPLRENVAENGLFGFGREFG